MITQQEIQEIIADRDFKSQEAMNKIQSDFDKVQEFWSNKYSEASDKELPTIQKEWNNAVEEAQLVFDKSVEELMKKEDLQLKEDQDKSEADFKKFEKEDERIFLEKLQERKKLKKLKYNLLKNKTLTAIEKELKVIIEKSFTPSLIVKRYNKTNNRKNGFSTTEIYRFLKGKNNPKEIEMAKYIYNKLK